MDFETTTKLDDCRVWVWGSYDVDSEEFVWGKDVASWLVFASRRNTLAWFHNLKFDGMFIIDFLLRSGYAHVDKRPSSRREFTTLISDMGMMYSIIIVAENGRKIELRDSAKKFPGFTVARIAKSFGHEEGKGDIDYHLERPIGYEPTPEELDYLRRDVKIVALAIRETLEEGMTRLTIGSDSLAEYKRVVGDNTFKHNFPVLSHALDAEIRRAYRGGFTYADPRYKGGLVGGGVVLDVNSLYPYIMSSKLVPYGEPHYSSGLPVASEDRPLTIFSVTFTAKLKARHIPCIQIKGSSRFSDTEYVRVIEEPVNLVVTNVDWELYNEHYDIDVYSYEGGWSFKAAYGMFDEYIDKWATIKAESVGGRRELSKLHLNSLYGKLATNPNMTGKIPELDLETDTVKLYRGTPERRAPVYTAAGVFITAWARAHTIRAAQDNYGTFAYADTDSLHLVHEGARAHGGLVFPTPPTLDVHDTRLGAWAFEYEFDAAVYMRSKAYSERLRDGSFVTRIAGLPTSISERLTFDDLFNGNVIGGKLLPKIVPGGVVLVDTPYKLVVE